MRSRLKKVTQMILIIVFLPSAWCSWHVFAMMPRSASSYILSIAAFVVIWLGMFVIGSIVAAMTCGKWIHNDQ